MALAVELAATMVLADYDLEVAKYAQLQAAAAIWGVKSEATGDPEIVWETVRELE